MYWRRDRMEDSRKETIDGYIKIVRKYYRTGDRDFLSKKMEIGDMLENKNKMTYSQKSLLQDLARVSQTDNKTYQQIYEAFNIFYPNNKIGGIK
jgi:hypothetical protein